VSVERLTELVRERQPCVVLTGAGVSTESGIPDFRSAEGIWARYDPMEYATIDAFLADPVKVWDFYGKRLNVLRDAEPNDGHRVLAELEERGWVRAVITQNIDRLHGRAGSTEVIEVHGSIASSSCLECGASYPIADVRARQAEAAQGVPRCDCDSPLKPDVVLFGELLPVAALARAERLAAAADLLLCIGSSLEVYPVAGLPEVTLSAGGKVAIVTQGPTPFDAVASARMSGDVVEELEALLVALDVTP
jgi:NAD-dependent deacetylase